MKGIKFTKNLPGVFLEREGILAVGDLHIGRDLKLIENGIYTPNATSRMIKDLLYLGSVYKAKAIALLGDVKESIGYPAKDEYAALLEFFSAMRSTKLLIAKGNHDSRIEEIAKQFGSKAEVSHEIILDEAALMHGHTIPSKEAANKNYIVSGHLHPALEIHGRLEKAYAVLSPGNGMAKEYGSYNTHSRLIILPAFNSMLTGSDFLSSGNFSPMLKRKIFDSGSAKFYGLDGRLINRTG